MAKRFGGLVDETVADRARDAAFWERIPIGVLLEKALMFYIYELERRRGSPFPPRPAPVQRGRPLNS